LRFAGQLKSEVLRYMIDKNTKIRQLQLGASNLIGDDTWRILFKTLGPQLQSLKLSELNDSFNDETVEEMAQHCYQLQRLKLRTCLKLREPSLTSISRMTTLEHLTLAVGQDASSETLVALIQNLGPSLKTLCLETYAEADDDVLVAIHTNCNQLSKLRLTGSIVCSDGGFANLFSNWRNPPMPYIDLSDNRDLDNANPEGPAEAPIGLGSEGFKALMKHSGSRLERLNVHSCRHISHEALSEVFDGRPQYPLLKDIDMSFVTVVDDFIMTGIFKSCPNLAKLAVFACFKARDARIPAGVAVIGLPNAQDAVVIEGDVVGEL
jgi:DNA repair protein RAD7